MSGNSYRRCSNKGCRRKAINEVVPQPHEYHSGKHITIFGWTLFIYKNEVNYQMDTCYDCYLDDFNEPIRRAVAEDRGEFYL